MSHVITVGDIVWPSVIIVSGLIIVGGVVAFLASLADKFNR